MEKVYINLKMMRVKSKFSMAEMAEKLDINQSSYFQLEKGETKLTIERLYEIAGIFKVSVLDLLGEESKSLDSPEIESLRNEIENLRKVAEGANHRVREFEVRASMYDKIERYYLDFFNDDIDDLYKSDLDFDYSDLLNPINDPIERFNSEAFIIFINNRYHYEKAIEEFSALRESKIIYAWKRFNYIDILHNTYDELTKIVGESLTDRFSTDTFWNETVDLAVKTGKYNYKDFEIKMIKNQNEEYNRKNKRQIKLHIK